MELVVDLEKLHLRENPARTHTRHKLRCWQGGTHGQGGTYDPEAVKGHVGIEVLQVFQPPLVCVWVGEVCKGSETRPYLWGHHKSTGSASR